eukprot:COSAG01_NODE_9390_length_2459_cov_2.323305_2_plen_244_part_00
MNKKKKSDIQPPGGLHIIGGFVVLLVLLLCSHNAAAVARQPQDPAAVIAVTPPGGHPDRNGTAGRPPPAHSADDEDALKNINSLNTTSATNSGVAATLPHDKHSQNGAVAAINKTPSSEDHRSRDLSTPHGGGRGVRRPRQRRRFLQNAAAAAAEKAALLATKAGGSGWPASWTAATDPCGTGWNDERRGWHGVKCGGQYGRVTYIHPLRLPEFTSGDVSAWSVMTQARVMCVHLWTFLLRFG